MHAIKDEFECNTVPRIKYRTRSVLDLDCTSHSGFINRVQRAVADCRCKLTRAIWGMQTTCTGRQARLHRYGYFVYQRDSRDTGECTCTNVLCVRYRGGSFATHLFHQTSKACELSFSGIENAIKLTQHDKFARIAQYPAHN